MSSVASRPPGPSRNWKQSSMSTDPRISMDNNRPDDSSFGENNTRAGAQPQPQPGADHHRVHSQTSSFPSITEVAHTTPSYVSATNLNALSPHEQSVFSFDDYLTPEYSSENPFSEPSNHTTPDIDSLYHQGDYAPSNDLHGPVTEHFSDFKDLSGIDINQALTGLVPTRNTARYSHESRLLSPELTGTASGTPERWTNTTQDPSHATMRNSHTAKRSRDEEFEAISSGSQSEGSPSLEPTRSRSQAMNPVVLISSFNRGDSPAGSQAPLSRNLSRRSQSSRRSEIHDPSTVVEPRSRPGLMPPADFEQDSWNDDEGQRSGLGPEERDAEYGPSLKDIDEARKLEETRAGVVNWLATSEAGSDPGGESGENHHRNRVRRERMRSRSTGGRHDKQSLAVFDDSHIPGPGALIDVESNHDYSDDESEQLSVQDSDLSSPPSPAVKLEALQQPTGDYFPPQDVDVAPDEVEPLGRQFLRRTPWQDPVRYSGFETVPGQPPTANAAMMEFGQRSKEFDTASRAATWGTRRRLSDSEISSIVEGSKVRHLSLSKKTRERGNSFLTRARGLIPKRSNSNIKKEASQSTVFASPTQETPTMPTPETELTRVPSHAGRPVQRVSSWGKPKSPPHHNTGSAIFQMANSIIAVGSSSSTATVPHDAHPPKSPRFGSLKRDRSRSELPKSPSKSTPGLSELISRHGGPPMLTLASPMKMPESSAPPAPEDLDDESEELQETEGVKMEMPIQPLAILPTLDGFKIHARQLNPRLQPYLIDRIAQDQVRRYKKLVKSRLDHTRNVQLKQQCPSGQHCPDLGGKPAILPPRPNQREASGSYAQFKVAAGADSDGEENGFTEAVVTPALFPAGIPLPPTTHLPAEFECDLCFQVKKFQKPSDWTKHVHEDVQPFSCTFPNCPEPKSFKRKADWVRHENERHRHLEWWRCSIQECHHICYRKDNFVQHLVREHKMTEPKGKGQRGGGGRSKASTRTLQSSGNEADDFWHLVDSCRKEKEDSPKSEPCKFCGNVCSTWKKLSVHVGKHMEQIAMPTLELAQKRIITPETVISPVDATPARSLPSTMLDSRPINNGDSGALSPYAHSAHSAHSVHSHYQSSSAGHSPAVLPVGPRMLPTDMNQGFYDTGMMSNGMPHVTPNHGQFAGGSTMPTNFTNEYYEDNAPANYVPLAPQQGYTSSQVTPAVVAHYNPHAVPRSQTISPTYSGVTMGTMTAPIYAQEQYYAGQHASRPYMDYGAHMNHTVHPGPQAHATAAAAPPMPGNAYMYQQHDPANPGPRYY